MANRTVQLLGQGYGASPAEITVTVNGNTVFSGTVNTVNQPLPEQPTNVMLNDVLCVFELDGAITGEIPMTCATSAGTVIFANILSNHVWMPNPIYTTEQCATLNDPTTPWADKTAIWTQAANPPFSQQDIDTLNDPTAPWSEKQAILEAHNCYQSVNSGSNTYRYVSSTDARNSVTINGVAQTPDRSGLPGTWWWTIDSGSTLGYQLDTDLFAPV